MHRLLATAIGTLTLLSSTGAASIEISADLSSELSYSNNISQESTATDDDISQSVGLGVVMVEKRKRFNADASFNLEETHYYRDTFENKTSLTTGFGIFNFDIIENFLNWRTSFTRTQVLKSILGSDNPDNQANRNIFRSGPSITYRVSRESTIGLTAGYTNVENSDDSASDTERVNGTVNYDYAFNSVTSFNLNGSYDEIIDGDGDEELNNTNVNFGVVRRFAQGQLSANYGRAETRSDISQTVSDNFFKVSLVRKQVFWHDLMFEYRQELSDTSIGFENDEEGFVNTILNDVAIGDSTNMALAEALISSSSASSGIGVGLDIIKREQMSISLNRSVGSYQYSLSGFWDNESYEVLNNDSKGRGFSLALNHNLAQNLNVGFSYSFGLKDYLDQPIIGKETTGTYRVESGYQLTQTLNLNGFFQYGIRMNATSQAREFEEFSSGISVSWSLL